MILALLLNFSIQAPALQAPEIDLHLVPSGTFRRVGGYRPYAAKLSPDVPKGVSGLPAGTEYATLKFGSGASQRSFLVAIEEPVSATSHIYVDSKGDGSLRSSAPLKWTAHAARNPAAAQPFSYDANITLDLPYQGAVVPCTVGIYPAQKDTLGYFADFSLQGKISLNGASYDAIYWDSTAVWNPRDGNGTLMIDTDHDGTFHPAYEFFMPKQPFNIKGTTYELRSNAGLLAVVKSAKVVKERTLADMPADPNLSNGLRPGKLAPTFKEKTMTGDHVNFPTSYSGKVVMLDFWATWCGPCMREAPNVAAVYAKYHSQGFEVLGVSLDNADAQDVIGKTTARVGMIWPEIYQGKGFKSKMAQLYGIKAIPATYLVDGDTGKVIAMLDQLREKKLEQTVKAALAAKHN